MLDIVWLQNSWNDHSRIRRRSLPDDEQHLPEMRKRHNASNHVSKLSLTLIVAIQSKIIHSILSCVYISYNILYICYLPLIYLYSKQIR